MVVGDIAVGGLVGDNRNGPVSDCFATDYCHGGRTESEYDSGRAITKPHSSRAYEN